MRKQNADRGLIRQSALLKNSQDFFRDAFFFVPGTCEQQKERQTPPWAGTWTLDLQIKSPRFQQLSEPRSYTWKNPTQDEVTHWSLPKRGDNWEDRNLVWLPFRDHGQGMPWTMIYTSWIALLFVSSVLGICWWCFMSGFLSSIWLFLAALLYNVALFLLKEKLVGFYSSAFSITY